MARDTQGTDPESALVVAIKTVIDETPMISMMAL